MTNMNEVVTSPAISSMLLGNRTTLFQTTPSRRSNWAVVAFCSCSLFFRFAVKSLLNVFSLVFGFLGGGVKVLLNFKQAPLAFCATWWRFLEQWLWEQLSQCCEVMHSWMLWNCCRAALNQRALVSSDSLLTPCSSALPSLLHLCYWDENMMGLCLTQFGRLHVDPKGCCLSWAAPPQCWGSWPRSGATQNQLPIL